MDVDVEPSSSKPIDPRELPEGFFDDPIRDAKVSESVIFMVEVQFSWWTIDSEIHVWNSRRDMLSTEIQSKKNGKDSRKKLRKKMLYPNKSLTKIKKYLQLIRKSTW